MFNIQSTYRKKKISILLGSVSQWGQYFCLIKLNKVTLKVATRTIRISKVLIQYLLKIHCHCLPVPSIHYIPIPN